MRFASTAKNCKIIPARCGARPVGPTRRPDSIRAAEGGNQNRSKRLNISDEEWKELAAATHKIHALLLQGADALHQGDHQSAEAYLVTAWTINMSRHNCLIAAGFADSVDGYSSGINVEPEKETLRNLPPDEGMPPHLLTTPVAKRYAEAIRAAAEACKELEHERNTKTGVARVLREYADIAENETFGPESMRGLES